MNQNKAKYNTVIMSRARTDLGSHSEPPLTSVDQKGLLHFCRPAQIVAVAYLFSSN